MSPGCPRNSTRCDTVRAIGCEVCPHGRTSLRVRGVGMGATVEFYIDDAGEHRWRAKAGGVDGDG